MHLGIGGACEAEVKRHVLFLDLQQKNSKEQREALQERKEALQDQLQGLKEEMDFVRDLLSRTRGDPSLPPSISRGDPRVVCVCVCVRARARVRVCSQTGLSIVDFKGNIPGR